MYERLDLQMEWDSFEFCWGYRNIKCANRYTTDPVSVVYEYISLGFLAVMWL